MKVLVIGSSIIDLFVQIQNEKNHVAFDANKAQFTLGDKIPIDISQLTIGGNGANVSVGLSRLTLPTTFYTYLGNDIFSKQIEHTLNDEGIELTVERKVDTGQSSLSFILKLSDDRIIFSHHQKRDHNFSYAASTPDFMYVTSIGNPWENAYQDIAEYTQQHKIPYAFAPGSHQLQEKGEAFEKILTNAHILFVNFEEACDILKLDKEQAKPQDVLYGLQKLGPQIISVTHGGKGAYALDEHGQANFIKPLPITDQAIEKTGAGDAYASGFLAAYLHEQSIEQAMAWGILNAYYSMQKIGAQEGLLKKDTMELHIKEHPEVRAEKL